MSVINDSWAIPLEKYTNHPGQWAYLEFQAWAERAVRKGHFSTSTSHDIVRIFDTALQSSSPIDSLHKSLKEQVKKDKITDGNSRKIQEKATKILRQKDHMPQTSKAPSAQAHAPQKLPESKIKDMAQRHGFIWFYKAPENRLTACFGNFFEVQGGVLGCKTSEGAFQAQKFVGDPFHLFARLDGEEAWKLGRSHTGKQKASWHQDGKVDAMRKALADKFKPGSPFASALLATGNSYLVEHNPVKGRDNFWSDDSDGSGKNMLGILLMKQRRALGGTGVVAAPGAYTRNAKNLH
jgi:ribA/ribD-fused uncharacterized protein